MPPSKQSAAQLTAKETSKEKRQKAAEARRRGLSWDKVARESGYASPGSAYQAVQLYYKDYPAPDVEQRRQEANDVLDQLASKAWNIVNSFHPAIQNGKIVGRYTGRFMHDENGEILFDHKDKPIPEIEEVEDIGAVTNAIGVVLRIEERRARLNGSDRALKINIGEEDEVNDEIKQLAETMTARAVAMGSAVPNE